MNIQQSARVTEVVHGEEAQQYLLEGVMMLHDPVASTLGACGRTVIIEDLHGNPKPTKDGVTVAKSIVPFDSFHRMGCEIIKQASLNTGESAGDGTTTSTVLAKSIIEKGLELMKDKSINYTEFNEGMMDAVDFVCKSLDEDSKKVDINNIESVATISSNNDPELGSIIADAFKKAGEYGVVLMEKSDSFNTFVSLTEGFELEKGYKSSSFVNVKESNRVEYTKCVVLVSNVKIERLNQIEHFAEHSIVNNYPLIIVSEMDDSLMAMFAMNTSRGKIKAVVIEPSHFGIRRKDILQDLAVATGATLIDEESSSNFDTTTFEDLGWCPNVVVDRNKTIFFNEQNKATKEHIEVLKSRLSNEKNQTEKKFLSERIAKISSAVAVVNVGASSSTEQSEKADRVEDAIHATRAALSEGIVAGGGVALHNSINKKREDFKNGVFKLGFECIMSSISQPLITILSNADIKYKSSDFSKINMGINVKTGEKGDMFSMNIIDPLKVTKTALRNAVSAATTLLSTTSVIVNLRKV